ncbi:PepSY domain-containing protein, partial [Acinetobacter baumannii]
IESINHVFMYGYYAIFLLTLIYTFVIGYAKALPQLLLTLVFVLFAIPLTSLLAYFIPQSGLWVHGGEILVVDLLAVIFAFAFWRF